MYTLEQLQQKTFGELKAIGWELNVLPDGDRRRRESWINAIAGVNPPLLQLLEVSPGVEVDRVQEPIEQTVENPPGVEVDQAQEPPIESKFGRIVYPRPAQGAISQVAKTSPGVEVDPVLEPISQVAKTSPGVEVDQLPECVECFGDGYFEDEWGLVKFCHCSDADPKLSHQNVQRAIVPATENFPDVECVYCTSPEYSSLRDETYRCYRCEPDTDQNPILTRLPLLDKFLARYSPPQAEVFLFQADANGQLSLIDFEVQSQPEPPDPDDFESLDEFREAIAIWDEQNESNSVHCEHSFVHSEPNSVHCEHSFVHSEPNSVYCQPPDPHDFDSMFAFWAAYDVWDEASDDDSEPLGISLDSFCEWAPCPEDWYEPHTLLEPSKVMELSSVRKSSITSDFFIPTFDRWGARSNRSDEPPDTGIFARLPKPKPPTFPPQAASWTQVGRKLDTSWTQVSEVSRNYPATIPQLSRNYPETIPKLFHGVVSGTSNQPARSPPGGDAMS